MGFRFRKSVKICKGVKVNFSKSGASLSVGGQGHSVNIGKHSRATLGIPGTGLSYSTSLSGYNTFNKHSNHITSTLPGQIHVIMNDDGKTELRDEKNIPITDPSVIRKSKATDSYKSMVNDLEIQRQQKLDDLYREAKEENDKFIEIYKQSPQVDRLDQYVQILNCLKPPAYVRKEYDVPCPTEASVMELLKSEAKETVTGSIFRVGKLRKEYVEHNLQSRTAAEIEIWTSKKSEFDAAEEKRAIAEIERYKEEVNAKKQYMNDIINGEDEVVNDAVESWIKSCELPVEINVDYEWNIEQGTMYLDVDLPEIEDIPENEIVRLASGNLKEKKKTQAKLKQEYVNLVFGLAIFITANVFNISPAIHNITISGYTQRRNKAGEINDEYVFSIKFIRDIFEKSVLRNVDPLEFCMKFENRFNMTNTMLLKKITPYEINQ